MVLHPCNSFVLSMFLFVPRRLFPERGTPLLSGDKYDKGTLLQSLGNFTVKKL